MLGATPEVLFEIPQKGLLRTMALASTQPSTADERNLFKCEKLLKEHQVVVKSIKKSLGHHGVVKVCNTRTLKLPNLTHLLTPIELTYTSDLSFLDLIRSLHPTPALGGAPRIAGWKWLKSLQKYGERRFFGAPFGIILKDGFMCSLVAIRGIQWVQDRLQISAGAGVLPESNVESEWHELNLKITAIKRLLGFEHPPLCMGTMSNRSREAKQKSKL
jgi:menaquinone-specific isochorismate synthase